MAGPASRGHRPADRAGLVDHARRADADAEDGGGRGRSDLVDELMDDIEGHVAIAAFQVATRAGGELAAEVRKGGGERAFAEVEGDDRAGVGVECDEGRLLAAGARAAADVGGQAVALEVATSSPTLVRVRPVRRAMSAREIGPRS